jgi:terminase small subunit-like protein
LISSRWASAIRTYWRTRSSLTLDTAICTEKFKSIQASLFCEYARAREVGYHMMAHELMVIADATETEPSEVAPDRLRCETRKWMLSNALPRNARGSAAKLQQ